MSRIWRYQDHVDTDVIIPARYLNIADFKELAEHAMEDSKEDLVECFAKNVQEGDIMVAGKNFGCGSSREHAAITLKAVNVGAVIADSFGRIFFRNAINLGIPAISCQNICKVVNYGDEVEVDFANGTVKNLTTGAETSFVPMSDYIMNILEHGGIKPMIKAQQDARKAE